MKVLRFPDPVLREKSVAITSFGKDVSDTAAKLGKVMRSSKGCVGVAAPQYGILKRIVVVDVSKHKKTTECHGTLVLVNPSIIDASGSTNTREGCLSVPDFTGNVERPDRVIVEYMNLSGKKKILATSGFEAVAVQHEMDHLDGILFIDRITNIKRDLFKRKKY